MKTTIVLTSIVQSEVVLLSHSRRLLDDGSVEITTATRDDIYTEAEKEWIERHVESDYIDRCEYYSKINTGPSSIEISFAFWVQLNSIVQSELHKVNLEYCIDGMALDPPDMPRYRFEIPRRVPCQHDRSKTVDSLDIYKCSRILVDIEYPYIHVDHYMGGKKCHVRLPHFEITIVRPICTMYDNTSDAADEISTAYSRKRYIGFVD